MTLHVLRRAMSNKAFFEMVRTWVTTRRYGNGTTKDLIQLANSVSGKKLDDLFQAWLFTPGKPTLGVPGKPAAGPGK